jgi:hypothetical protein
MGNKNIKKKDNNSNTSSNTKTLKKGKDLKQANIYCLGQVKYKDNYYASIGLSGGKIEVYDTNNLDLVANYNAFKYVTPQYIHYLHDDTFILTGSKVYIFVIYKNTMFVNKDNKNSLLELKYNIEMIQQIEYPLQSNIGYYWTIFLKSFIFDRNLYKKDDIYEKNDENQSIDIKEEELIINCNKGILIFKRNEENKNDKKEEDNFDLDNYKKNWENNPYIYKQNLSSIYNYDIEQVNYKYIASTVDNYVLLYSMEEYEIITKYEVKISDRCYKIMFMLTDDILIIGGDDTITLISIKDFEISLISTIKPNYKITEICILPNSNIIIGIQNKDKNIKIEEFLYQYQYYSSVNKSTKKLEHNIYQISTELLTNNNSNITFECLNNSLLAIVDKRYILTYDIK